MHVLITGGAGFIGSHLAEYHLDRGDKVHVVDNLSTGRLSNLASFERRPGFRFDQADVVTWPGLDKAVAWGDRIYHLAAVVGVYRVLAEPIACMATNIAGCERVLRAVSAGGWRPQLVIASSSEVYGPQGDRALGEDDPLVIQSGAPLRWNYAISKLADEAFALAYARQHDLPVVLARLFNTVGPRQTGRYGMVVPRFVRQAVIGEPVTVFGDGTQTRSFCDVRDTAEALDRLAAVPEAVGGLIVNVGNDRELSIQALARLVIARAGSDSPLQYIPFDQAYGEHFEDIPRRRPRLERLGRLTGFRPTRVLEQTLDELIAQARAGLQEPA